MRVQLDCSVVAIVAGFLRGKMDAVPCPSTCAARPLAGEDHDECNHCNSYQYADHAHNHHGNDIVASEWIII